MGNVVTKAVVNNPDGTLFARQEHEINLSCPEMEEALADGLAKQKKFLDDLKDKQRKEPDAVYSAVLSCTGQEDVTYTEFTYDMYQKAARAWNQMIEELLRIGERHMRKS